MKKTIVVLLLLSLVLSFFGCSTATIREKEIKCVSVNENTYFPVYLYTYSNASLIDENDVLPSETQQLFQKFVTNGYFLSTNKYNIGQLIEVDFSCFYGEDGLKLSNEDRENYANKKVSVNITEVEKKKISVQEKEDTFVITYNAINSIAYDVNCDDTYVVRKYSSLSQSKERLNELVTTNEIETVKENIIISYDT